MPCQRAVGNAVVHQIAYLAAHELRRGLALDIGDGTIICSNSISCVFFAVIIAVRDGGCTIIQRLISSAHAADIRTTAADRTCVIAVLDGGCRILTFSIIISAHATGIMTIAADRTCVIAVLDGDCRILTFSMIISAHATNVIIAADRASVIAVLDGDCRILTFSMIISAHAADVNIAADRACVIAVLDGGCPISAHAADITIAADRACVVAAGYFAAIRSAHAADSIKIAADRACVIAVLDGSLRKVTFSMIISAHATDVVTSLEVRINDPNISYGATAITKQADMASINIFEIQSADGVSLSVECSFVWETKAYWCPRFKTGTIIIKSSVRFQNISVHGDIRSKYRICICFAIVYKLCKCI